MANQDPEGWAFTQHLDYYEDAEKDEARRAFILWLYCGDGAFPDDEAFKRMEAAEKYLKGETKPKLTSIEGGKK